ncbi:hypothetical protein ES703_79975 [subsurface metagenome]
MTLEKAIKILELNTQQRSPSMPPNVLDALKLGTEALKRVKLYKEAHVGLHYEPMPGESPPPNPIPFNPILSH